MPTKLKGTQLETGTGPGSVVVLDGSSRLPAVDGSQLTNLSGISNLVDDTSPQLGGTLDLNDFQITGKPPATTTSSGGVVTINGGAGGATSGNGGNINVTAGNASGTSQPGSVNIQAGDGVGTQPLGGTVIVSSGDAAGGTQGGHLYLRTGLGTILGGHIYIQPAGLTNFCGDVYIQNPTAGANDTPNLIFNEAPVNGGNGVQLKAPLSIATPRIWILPQDDPVAAQGQFLTTSNTGVLSFAAPESPFKTYSCSSAGTISKNPAGWSITKGATGIYTLTHKLGLADVVAQSVFITSDDAGGSVMATITVSTANTIAYILNDDTGASVDRAHRVMYSPGNIT